RASCRTLAPCASIGHWPWTLRCDPPSRSLCPPPLRHFHSLLSLRRPRPPRWAVPRERSGIQALQAPSRRPPRTTAAHPTSLPTGSRPTSHNACELIERWPIEVPDAFRTSQAGCVGDCHIVVQGQIGGRRERVALESEQAVILVPVAYARGFPDETAEPPCARQGEEQVIGGALLGAVFCNHPLQGGIGRG